MKYLVGSIVLIALSVPGYVVLRSMAVDNGTLWEHFCAGFVSGMFTQVTLKYLFFRR